MHLPALSKLARGLLLASGTLLTPWHLATAAVPSVETLMHFTGNLPEGGNGTPVSNSPWNNYGPATPLISGKDGTLFFALPSGAGACAADAPSSCNGAAFYSYAPEAGITLLQHYDQGKHNRWLQFLTAGTDGALYSNGRNLDDASGLMRWNAITTQWEIVGATLDVPGSRWVEASNGLLFAGSKASATYYDVIAISKNGENPVSYPILDASGSQGRAPKIHLSHSNGRLYGTVTATSAAAAGIFSIDPSAPVESFQSVFRSAPEYPYGVRIMSMAEGKNGMIYVTSNATRLKDGDQGGDIVSTGVLYRVRPENAADASNYEPLHEFGTTEERSVRGASPNVLVTGPDGHIYGVASSGGLHGSGMIFRWNTEKDLFESMYDFALDPTASTNDMPSYINEDGMYPFTLITNGENMYGLTLRGGTHGKGTLLRFTPGDELGILAQLRLSKDTHVAQGYTQEISWLSRSTTGCQASTDEPSSTWAGERDRNGAESITFNAIGTWRYTLTCDTGSEDTPTVTDSITVTVASITPDEEHAGSGGGALPTWLIPLLLWPLRRRAVRAL